nr:PDZ and LIM domain protein Zasp isoform X1 [Vanessa tameamea]
MAQLITVRLNKSDQQPLGFRLQGGKDFGTPLVVQKVNGGSAAERAGLQAGDALIRVNNTDVYALRHQEAQDAIRAAGQALELTVQRGGGTWRPSVTATGSLPRPGTRPLGASPVPVTNTSLKATPQPTRAFGSGHNSVAKPFGYMNGNDSVKSIVNKQYNTPVNMYSDKTIAETLSAQTEVLAGGVLGVNFKKNEKTYDAEKSAVFKVLQEEQNDPEPVAEASPAVRHVAAPAAPAPGGPAGPAGPTGPTGGLPVGQNICEECERLITGVFVRIKDKNMHVECFKCSTCGSSLKNQGYYNINGKLYCDIHAKLVARQNPPAANLEPVTVPPGGRVPSNAYSTPLPPLATSTYTNGSSSMFSPSSTLSGPKPFGSSVGSAYSPASLSPRSAPLSPARPAGPPAGPPAGAPGAPYAPKAPVSIFKAKNVKSIVWPPSNHADDETEKEINPNFVHNTPYSDSSASARESLMMTTNSNINFSNQMRSFEESVSSAKQTPGLPSDTTFGSALMSTSQATSKSEFSVQSQKSQMIQEIASCSVQSFSEKATSEKQNFAMYQTQAASDQIDSNKQITKKDIEKLIESQENQFLPLQSEYNTSNAQKMSQEFAMKQEQINKGYEIKSLNVKQDDKIAEANIQQQTSVFNNYNHPPVFISTETENKESGITAKTSNMKQNQNAPFLKKCNPSENKQNLPAPHTYNPTNPKVQSKTPSKENPKMAGTTKVTNKPTIERGSLIEALTIAPERPYSPLSFHIPNPNYASTSFDQNQMQNSELLQPMPNQNTDNSTYRSDPNQFGQANMQANMFQTSSEASAFKPVSRQTLPPQQPQEFCGVPNYPNQNKDFVLQQQSNTNFSENFSTSISGAHQGFSPITTAECYSTQPNSQNTMVSPILQKSGLHRPDSIPPYQQNLESSHPQIISDLHKAQPTNLGSGQREIPLLQKSEIPQIRTPVPQPQTKFKTETSMSFQPVHDEAQNMSRYSPTNSRPSTPSMINKPAPIIPHYQMNLVTVEHVAPEGRMYKPGSGEVSRSSTPKLRSRSPAPTLPAASNSLKAQAPRIKDSTQRYNVKQCQPSVPPSSSFKKEYDTSFQDNNVKKWLQNQPALVKEEQQSNLEYQTESYNRGNIKEDSMINQNYGQRQMESQNKFEYGSTTVESMKKTFEQFESAQSAKTIEIRQGAVQPSNTYQQNKPTIQPSNYNLKQVFPPPIKETMSPQQNLSFNTTNQNVATFSNQTEVYQPTPYISGANQGPVCDPTPSTGSSVGAAARGKAFGVSSAPKRGRGVLNKAALPGSRVPLCGSCNGNIRGPFITALGRIWCPEHFICVNATCRRQLQDIGFVEENGQLYCEYCFEQYIAPACDKCHAKIKGDCLNAIGKHFHPECFSCVYCQKLFGNNPFFLEDGLPYCEADWNELFTTKCFACGFPVEAGDRWVEALNNNYHSQCFNCTVCKKNLEGQSFFAKGGRPFCKMHAR